MKIATLAAASLLLAGTLANAQPRGEALVYERPGFGGRSVALRDDMGNLELVGFNDRAASLYVIEGTWEFCTDAWYRGSCRLYGPGQHRDLGPQARRISSGRLVGADNVAGHAMRPGEGRWQDVGRGDVSLFDASDFRGFLATLSDPARDFERLGINDRVASLIVNRGTWEFCTDAQFRGNCHTYGPGEYRALSSGRDDAYSSARPVSGAAPAAAPGGRRSRITLFDGADFHGRSVRVDGPIANLELVDFNDRARSIAIESGTWRVCADARGEGECAVLGPGRYPSIPRALQGKVSSILAVK